jgi:hypothetical protein
MEFYIPVKEIKRVAISNGGGKGTGTDTTAVAGGNPPVVFPPVAGFHSGRCFRWCWFSGSYCRLSLLESLSCCQWF